ncbi:oil body-associated protein 1B-like [Gastrolobium bilobum]|uniref:oil body-associated protein 1B-like n=1 Tax=Gastrolobium bilobum TaxID=150636 RepID=UPI002AB24FB0|nr:oil body-associated protein 1B-like [Gastrolobium bilobum]
MSTNSTYTEVPGVQTTIGTSILETATAAIQGFGPVNKIHQHQCAFHFYSYDMTRQLEAHHFCAHQNEEMRQCLIYDSPEDNAKLIGIEYIISENLFLTLPDEEKRLWHSHEYEVKSGLYFMPGVPGPIERKDMENVCKTYGKVYHFWQVDKGDTLPLGIPQLMMSLTRDGQIYDELVQSCAKRMGKDFEKERKNREYMTGPTHGIHPLANGGGKGLKTKLREVELKDYPAPPSATRVYV